MWRLPLFLATAMAIESFWLSASAIAFYHPQMGRFVNRDPGAFVGTPRLLQTTTAHSSLTRSASSPRGRFRAPGYMDSPNLYQYGLSNPVTHRDPMGTRRMD